MEVMTIGIPKREIQNEIVLTKRLSLSGAPIDQNSFRFSQIQYGNIICNGYRPQH